MSQIEKTSKTIASNMAAVLNLDKDREEVLQYGAFNLLHTSISFILLIFFGLLTKTIFEILVISLTAAFLRQFSGGVHATSPNRCAALGVVFFGGLAIAAKYTCLLFSITQVIFFQGLSILLAVILIYRYSPADNPNKRITNPKTRFKLRIKSLTCVMFFTILAVILWGLYNRYNYPTILKGIICIHTGITWQALSITPMMRSIVHKMDSLLIKIKL
jgi:accessory gene regulator B